MFRAQQVFIAITLLAGIRDVHGLNLGREISIPELILAFL
jgi:hypothetical protein